MLEAPQLNEVSQALLKAAELIEKRGWWNGKEHTSRFGLPHYKRTLCAILAICEATPLTELIDNRKLRAQTIDCLGNHITKHAGIAHITAWNDNSDAKTVTNTMKEAAYNASLEYQDSN